MIRLRVGSTDDFAAVFPRTRALNAHEGIAIDDARLAAALRRLLGDPEIGGVWLIESLGSAETRSVAEGRRGASIERDGAVIGYAIVTFGYDLEFAGRDAYLTELWIDDGARGGGAGTAVLALLPDELRARGVNALHLQVRRENPAFRLYERSGFVASPRTIMTRRL